MAMTFAEGVGLVTQVFVALGVVANVVQNLMQSNMISHVHKKVEEVDHKVAVVEHATNSMKDDLVTAVRAEAFQAGKLDEAASAQRDKS